MTTTTKPTGTTRKSKAFLYVGILIAAIWVCVFTALAVLQPTLKTKAIILAAGAGATEHDLGVHPEHPPLLGILRHRNQQHAVSRRLLLKVAEPTQTPGFR